MKKSVGKLKEKFIKKFKDEIVATNCDGEDEVDIEISEELLNKIANWWIKQINKN